jgi:hypothetical protein
VELNAAKRNSFGSSVFGLPSQRKYPLNDRAHQINAEQRATQMVKRGKLSPSSAAMIKAKANRLLSKGK